MNALKQQGMSSLGLLFVLCLGGFIVFTGFKIVPLYGNDAFIGSSLKKMTESDLEAMSNSEIRSQIGKHFTVDSVRDISPKQVKINRKSNNVVLTLDYEKRIEFLGNLDVVARFSHKIDSDDSPE